MSDQNSQDIEETFHQPDNKGRIFGSAVVAIAALLALGCAAAALFFIVASLLRSEWLFALVGVVAFVLMYGAINRLLRVSANRSSAALKSHKKKDLH